MEWPPLLRKLTFGCLFSQSLEGVRFPDGLQETHTSGIFNGEVSRVMWPKGLQILRFRDLFDQALVSPDEQGGTTPDRKHALPAGLKHLDLGRAFD